MMTPRRLEFGASKLIIEFPHEGYQGRPEHGQKNHMVIHPNMSGRFLGDRPQGVDNPKNNRGILEGLQDKIEVGLSSEELKNLYDNL